MSWRDVYNIINCPSSSIHTTFCEFIDQWSYTQRDQSGILQKPEVKSSWRLSENQYCDSPQDIFQVVITNGQLDFERNSPNFFDVLKYSAWNTNKLFHILLSRNGVVYCYFYFLNWSHTHDPTAGLGVGGANADYPQIAWFQIIAHNPFSAICSQKSQ